MNSKLSTNPPAASNFLRWFKISNLNLLRVTNEFIIEKKIMWVSAGPHFYLFTLLVLIIKITLINLSINTCKLKLLLMT